MGNMLYRRLFDLSVDLLCIIDAEGRFMDLSPSWQSASGYPISDLKLMPFTQHIHPGDVAYSLSQIERTRLGESVQFENRLLKKDESSRRLQWSACFDPDTQLVFCSARDIETQGSGTDVAFYKSLRMRDEFLSVASHELRTPLTPFRLNLGMLNRGLQTGQPKSSNNQLLVYLSETLNQQLTRITGLVDDLLDVSQIHLGRLPLERRTIDVLPNIQSVIEQHRTELEEAKIEVKIATGQPIRAECDPKRMAQVIAILISNAIKFAPSTQLEISCFGKPDRKSFEIIVVDQGIGIPERDVDRIFLPFERIVSSENFGGFGLGLYIARRIVEAHGGTIRCESKPGTGSRFILNLPTQMSPLGA